MGQFQSVLVFSGGATLNAAQRSDAVELLRRSKAPAAIVTRSPVVRQLTTAFSWFGLEVSAFGPSELGAALAYAGVAKKDQWVVVQAVRERTRALQAAGSLTVPPAA